MDALARKKMVKLVRVLLAATWSICAIGTALIVWEVETVLFTGPVLFLAGAGLLGFAWACRYVSAGALGVLHMGVCVLFFSLVVALRWGPNAARIPFMVMSILYAALTLYPALFAIMHPPRVHVPGTCVQCGYILYGLPEPRCPECGKPFDPATVPHFTAQQLEQLARR
jgi:hypothetical protein